MIVKKYDIDLDDYRLWVDSHQVSDGFYIDAYLKTKTVQTSLLNLSKEGLHG